MPSAELMVSYTNFVIWTAEIYEFDPDRVTIPVDDVEFEIGTPNPDSPYGLSIPVRSAYNPITVEVDMDGNEPSSANPIDRIWSGSVEFLNDTVFVESFDQMPAELNGLFLSRGAGRYDVTVEWAYIERAGLAEPCETVTVRFS